MSKKTFFSSLVEARQRQANRYVSGYLAALDDETLKSLGYDRKQLQRKGNMIYPL